MEYLNNNSKNVNLYRTPMLVFRQTLEDMILLHLFLKIDIGYLSVIELSTKLCF